MGRENRMNAVNEISVPPHSDYHINTKMCDRFIPVAHSPDLPKANIICICVYVKQNNLASKRSPFKGGGLRGRGKSNERSE